MPLPKRPCVPRASCLNPSRSRASRTTHPSARPAMVMCSQRVTLQASLLSRSSLHLPATARRVPPNRLPTSRAHGAPPRTPRHRAVSWCRQLHRRQQAWRRVATLPLGGARAATEAEVAALRRSAVRRQRACASTCLPLRWPRRPALRRRARRAMGRWQVALASCWLGILPAVQAWPPLRPRHPRRASARHKLPPRRHLVLLQSQALGAASPIRLAPTNPRPVRPPYGRVEPPRLWEAVTR